MVKLTKNIQQCLQNTGWVQTLHLACLTNLCTIQEKRLRLYNGSYLKIVFIYGQVAGAHTVKLVLRLINQRSLPKAGKENGVIVHF